MVMELGYIIYKSMFVFGTEFGNLVLLSDLN